MGKQGTKSFARDFQNVQARRLTCTVSVDYYLLVENPGYFLFYLS